MKETEATPDSDETICSGCYIWGVLISLLASSIQSIGYALWRLHHLRTQRQQVHPTSSLSNENRTSAQEAFPQQSVDDSQDKFAHRNSLSERVIASGQGLDADEMVHEHRTQADGGDVAGTHDDVSAPGVSGSYMQLQPDPVPLVTCWKGTSFYGIPWVWVAGLAAIGVGNGLDFISLGLTKQSVVTLVGSWSLVVTTMLSPLLGEALSRLDVGAAAVTIAGIVLTVLGGYTEVRDWSPEKLIRQYRRPHVAGVSACAVGVGGRGGVSSERQGRIRRRSVSKGQCKRVSSLESTTRAAQPLRIAARVC